MYKILSCSVATIIIIFLASLSGGQLAQASGTHLCQNPARGVLEDWYGRTDTYLVGYYMNTIQIHNTSQSCAYKVGIASYKAYEHYRINVFSQRHFASQTHVLQPGEKWTYTVSIPACTYQTDVYWGDTLYTFAPPSTTYSGQGRFLDGWYFPGNKEQQGKLPVCHHTPPTPTFTVTPTPTPTPTFTVTPTPTPSPTFTVSPTPPTPTPTPTSTPTVLGTTIAPTPPPELPSTGPGAVAALAFGGPLAALMIKKYYIGQ